MRITSLTPRSEVLQGPRLEIYGVIDAKPGIHFRAIQRETGIPAGNASHHLGVLERLDFIYARRVGPRRCYTTSLADLESLDETTQYVQRPEVQEILAAVEAKPGARQCDYMDALPDVPRSTVQQRLNRLAELDVLRKQHRQGTSARYWPSATEEGV